jgi:hypothetical protein
MWPPLERFERRRANGFVLLRRGEIVRLARMTVRTPAYKQCAAVLGPPRTAGAKELPSPGAFGSCNDVALGVRLVGLASRSGGTYGIQCQGEVQGRRLYIVSSEGPCPRGPRRFVTPRR